MTTLTTVSLTVPMDDSRFDDAYDRLEQPWEAWPPTEDDWLSSTGFYKAAAVLGR